MRGNPIGSATVRDWPGSSGVLFPSLATVWSGAWPLLAGAALGLLLFRTAERRMKPAAPLTEAGTQATVARLPRCYGGLCIPREPFSAPAVGRPH